MLDVASSFIKREFAVCTISRNVRMFIDLDRFPGNGNGQKTTDRGRTERGLWDN